MSEMTRVTAQIQVPGMTIGALRAALEKAEAAGFSTDAKVVVDTGNILRLPRIEVVEDRVMHKLDKAIAALGGEL